MGQAERLMQDPRFGKLLQDERVIRAVTRAFELRGQVQSRVDAHVESVARTLNLATKGEVRDLKRMIRKLERELGRARAEAASAKADGAASDGANGA